MDLDFEFLQALAKAKQEGKVHAPRHFDLTYARLFVRKHDELLARCKTDKARQAFEEQYRQAAAFLMQHAFTKDIEI